MFFIFSDKILSFSEGKLYGENIVYTNTTPYQRIVLTHNKSDYRLYLNNNLPFSSTDEYRYHEALVHPALSMAKSVSAIVFSTDVCDATYIDGSGTLSNGGFLSPQ